jgi:hypothetical protein
MLTITADATDSVYSPCWEFECPECKRVNYFYSIARKQCIGCQAEFLFTPGGLIKNKEERIKYHVSGE